MRAGVGGTKVKLLGYCVDPDDETFGVVLEQVREYRCQRNREIVSELQSVAGLDREYESIQQRADGILGRPHLASLLVEAETVNSIRKAFDQYLGADGSVYVPVERVPAHDVIEAIQRAGGVVSLAHSRRIRASDVSTLLDKLVKAGLDAIVVNYPYATTPSEGYADVSVSDAAELANDFELLRSGRSDCHGPDSGKFRIGDVRAPTEWLTEIRSCADTRQAL